MRTLRQRAVCCALIAIAAASLFAFKIGPASARSSDRPITIYLGFDDGPAPGLTDSILDTLKKYNVKATFFIEGAHIHGNESLLQREIREGHHIGNHLVSEELNIYATNHPKRELLLQKYAATEAAINSALGPQLSGIYNAEEPIKPFRWPGGAIHAFPLPIVTYNWEVTTGDDAPGGVTAQQVINNVLYGYPPSHYYGVFAWGDGAVVLLDDESRAVAAALPLLLKNLQAYNVQFGTLPRPGDLPGTMPIILGAAPPCSHRAGNCRFAYFQYPLIYRLPDQTT